jgi:hypothetical protein
MPSIICYVADLKVPHDSPLGETLEVSGRSVSDYFQQASLLPDGTPALDLMLDYSRRLTPQAGIGVDDVQLQDALKQLLQPSSADHKAVPAIGLILTDVYMPMGNLYGFMFDIDSHEPSYGPRQGCTVFLNKIDAVIKNANKGEEDFRNLVAYTAIHEIGHIFNLWHVDAPVSFMTQYPGLDFLQACSFVSHEMNYLRYAADPNNATYVLPGGSAFGDRGSIGDSGGGQPYLLPQDSVVKFEIKLSHQEFWQFEPVELDVQLSVPDSKSGAVTVPDEIDPGYACFEIWITRPDQERHRYRPLKRFCGNPKSRKLLPDEPFRRDISIFRQSGGYTFAQAGKYQIQAALQLSPGKSVQSNTLECEVLRADPDSAVYTAMHDLFSSQEIVNLLRYKSRMPSRSSYARLAQFVDTHYATSSGAAVHYCLGRALLNSSAIEAEARRSHRLRQQGCLHLERAADHRLLSSHRLMIAHRLLNELGTAGLKSDHASNAPVQGMKPGAPGGAAVRRGKVSKGH